MSTSNRNRPLRLALFVEGTRGKELESLWNRFAELLGLSPFERVEGFSKHHMAAMSKANLELRHRTSTISVGLDVLIANALEKEPFDCAVVAWDLVPAWDSGSDASACRWDETLLLYEGLARSRHLPTPWRERAEQRWGELRSRERPSSRSMIPAPAPNTVLGVCMEPEFEGLLLNEAGVKSVLGLKGRRPRDWPDTWKRTRDPRPSETLARAIEAARRIKPKPKAFSKVHRSLREAKHEWATLLLNAATSDFRRSVLEHPTSKRLKLLLAASTWR